jgi:hypothetical protein
MNESDLPDPTGNAASEDRYEHRARAAGAAVRHPAPHDGIDRLHHARRRQQVRRASAVGAFAVVVGLGVVVFSGQSSPAVGANATTPTSDSNRAVPAVVPPSSTLSVTPHPVTFTVTWSMGGNIRDCGYTTTACMHHFATPAASAFDGDIAGRAYELVYWTDPVYTPNGTPQGQGHEEFVNTYEIHGTVAGCGTVPANFMMMEMAQTKDLPDIDFDVRSVYSGTWQIVPESGRDALSSISGSGTSTGDITYADPTTYARTFTGTISCP